MTDNHLLVWRDGAVHGALTRHRGRLTFTYEPGARPISVSMPVRARPYGDQIARTWFRGLLPEGQIRAMIAYDVGVDANDDFGLLRVLGRDCAGALSLRHDDDAPGDEPVGPALSDEKIGALLRALPTSPMGVDGGFRVSLPGNQNKLLLTRSGGRWHRPDGAPSTHILKPAIQHLDAGTVENEAYCQWLALAAGLPAATTTIGEFDGVRVLVSERFDRTTGRNSIGRIHQEDGCQALTVDPADKYQTRGGGPSLRAIAAVLAGNGGEPRALLQLATFTVAIGNADMHGKNVSMVFARDDSVTLSPVYDAMSTRLYETAADGRPLEQTLGLHIGNETHVDSVTAEHLIAEGRTWGMSTRLATRTVDDAVEAIRSALDHVDAPTERLRSLISGRITRLAR